MKKIKLVIIDDNVSITDILKDYFSMVETIEVVGIANDGATGYKLIQETKCDVILLDMIVPIIDGIGILEKLNQEMSVRRPACIIMSAVSTEKYVNMALEMGADYYVVKPFDLQLLKERIERIYQTHQSIQTKSVETYKKGLKTVIQQCLVEIGFPSNALGFKYYLFALYYILKKDLKIYSLTKEIYPAVAQYYSSSDTSVEKAMRNVITNLYQERNEKYIQFLANNNLDKDKPSNGDIIFALEHWIRGMEYEK